ncbi:MAG: cyclic pyranopterin monophosphate synthase MoaC [Candidatus Fermentibacteraceae bacterium]|nr:cyclic pyranopterin monophosphate synthase MoaC [Candidatus Fermentibacteraceae bacterium]MBN2609817.1 cyclic pyranopterin monophosphate synthase MoaC [Candidatus Fermentibacteraceae bacterium]
MKDFSHLDMNGSARMVDVSGKEVSRREAVACGTIVLGENASRALDDSSVPKGDVFAAARIGAISAVKRTWETIPLCHPLRIGGVEVEIEKEGNEVTAKCRVTGTEATGFEMEALNGAVTALLVVYDMTKALDRGMEIRGVRLLSKSGGKSGDYRWQQ